MRQSSLFRIALIWHITLLSFHVYSFCLSNKPRCANQKDKFGHFRLKYVEKSFEHVARMLYTIRTNITLYYATDSIGSATKVIPKYVDWSLKSEEDKDDNVKQESIGIEKLQLQTAVMVFQHPIYRHVIVELHAQLHYADLDYYEYFNSDNFNTDEVVAVLYELLLDKEFVRGVSIGDNSRRVLNGREKLRSSIKDEENARQYGWKCQVDGIDYMGNTNKYKNWFHADFTIQELIARKSEQSKSGSDIIRTMQQFIQPVGTALEAATALLIGPPVVLQPQRNTRRQRRLFTNMFISGDSFAVFLRWTLWFTIPCPELSILLLDSSSLWLENSMKQDRDNNRKKDGLVSVFSPIILPLCKSLITGQLLSFRKILFGQVVVAANAVVDPNEDYSTNSDWNIVVTERNEKALTVLQHEIEAIFVNETTKPSKIALLYGCSHCPDLHQRLLRLGFIPMQTKWRTAWSVPIQKQPKDIDTFFCIGLILMFYLSLGALDWIGTVQDVAAAFSSRESSSDLEIGREPDICRSNGTNDSQNGDGCGVESRSELQLAKTFLIEASAVLFTSTSTTFLDAQNKQYPVDL